MATASWKNVVIASAPMSEIVIVEGNLYFPRAAVKDENLRASSHQSACPWKGTANYFDVVVGSDINQNAAWYYATPKDAAKEIAGRVAFWKGITVNRES